jgi:hypothetical protein
MAKDQFEIKLVEKKDCKDILEKYHYLSKIQRGFKSGYNYGLWKDGKVVGVCIYTGLPVKELLKGMLGKDFNSSQDGYFELSRLVLDPEVQATEHNLASWFVARTIRDIKKQTEVKAILSYADSGYHAGKVYQALGFKYYGLTDKKKDFFYLLEDGTYLKHSRGPTKGYEGEWRERTRKHRYLRVFDKNVSIKWEELPYPTLS